MLEELAEEVIETDVLIIGGGLGGCMAAIKAREHNVKVVIIDKAAIKRSGEGGQGIDHYGFIAHPKINDITPQEYGHIQAESRAGLASMKLTIITAENVLKPLVVLEDIGVKIREDDGTLIMHSGYLGMVRTTDRKVGLVGYDAKEAAREEAKKFKKGDFIFYRGADLKLKLAAAVHKMGVEVFERTMPTSLITRDGSVVGATAVNVRNGKFLVFKAKATILATGAANRLYSYPFAPFPHNLFSQNASPSDEGGGVALACKAGAEVTNMEYLHLIVRPAIPQAAINQLGVKLLNSKGEEIRKKYPMEVKAHKLPEVLDVGARTLYMPDPSTPEIDRDVFMYNLPALPEELEVWSWNSFASRAHANISPEVLPALRDRGGLRKAPLEARVRCCGLVRGFSGVIHDERGETSLKGLFVVGDVAGGKAGGGSSGAFTWGYICGNYAAEDAVKAKGPVFDTAQVRQVQAVRESILAPLMRKEGINPLELEDLVRKIMGYYVHVRKVEPKLKRGLELLKVLKERFVPTLKASNPHQLMRAIEVQNIIEVAELHATASLIRTETRMPPNHYRMDYPERDDVNWRRNIILKNLGGKMEYTLQLRE